MSIRIASTQDLNGINQLILATHKDPCSVYKPPYPMDQIDIMQSENRVTFVSENEEQLIGYLMLHSDKSFQDDNNSAEFEMCVHPNYRRQGKATKLLEHTFSYVKNETNLDCIKLGLSKENPKAKKLYKRLGFFASIVNEKGEWMVKDIIR